MSAGKVEIGAFRTYPEVSHLTGLPYRTNLSASLFQGYTPPNAAANEYQSIPLDKIEDFGVHANAYYQLKVSVFKSSLDTKLLDLLWNKYWVNTLSQSQIVTVSTIARLTIGRLVDG